VIGLGALFAALVGETAAEMIEPVGVGTGFGE